MVEEARNGYEVRLQLQLFPNRKPFDAQFEEAGEKLLTFNQSNLEDIGIVIKGEYLFAQFTDVLKMENHMNSLAIFLNYEDFPYFNFSLQERIKKRSSGDYCLQISSFIFQIIQQLQFHLANKNVDMVLFPSSNVIVFRMYGACFSIKIFDDERKLVL